MKTGNWNAYPKMTVTMELMKTMTMLTVNQLSQ